MMLFKRKHFYIQFYFDKIEVTELETGVTIIKSAFENFSTKRLVIGNYTNAELLLVEIITSFIKSKNILKNQFEVLMQQMEIFEDGISEIEKRVYRDLAEQVGAVKVHLVLHNKKLKNEEALLLIRSNKL